MGAALSALPRISRQNAPVRKRGYISSPEEQSVQRRDVREASFVP